MATGSTRGSDVKRQTLSSVMGKRKGVFKKLVAFVCTFRRGKVHRCDSGCALSPVDTLRAVQVAPACDVTAWDEGDSEPGRTVTAISR
jgi:hypothetical protein